MSEGPGGGHAHMCRDARTSQADAQARENLGLALALQQLVSSPVLALLVAAPQPCPEPHTHLSPQASSPLRGIPPGNPWWA